jgi:hypothetical protein
MEGGKPEDPGKNPCGKGENQIYSHTTLYILSNLVAIQEKDFIIELILITIL